MNESMVMTIHEGHVPLQHWDDLQRAAEGSMQDLPTQMVASYLVQSHSEPTLWRIISIWHSQDALEEYRRSVHVPEDLRIFRAAGVEPALITWHVVTSMHNPSMVE